MDDDGVLPEPIIHRILSFLPLLEIMKAALVCKSWNRACSSFPTLDLDIDDLLIKIKSVVVPAPDRRSFTVRKLERAIGFADETVARFRERSLKIDRLSISYRCYDYKLARDWIRAVNKWIGIALDSSVEIEKLTIVSSDCVKDLISERILSAPTVYSMKFVGGGFAFANSSSFRNAPVNLENLRSLALVRLAIDDWVFDRLVNACQSLESLSVKYCTDLKEIRVHGLRRIKRMDLRTRDCTRLAEIDAPSLESFRFMCVAHVGLKSFTPNHSPNLKSLYLANNSAVTDEWLAKFLSRFSVLEDLTFSYCSSLTRIRISNPSVKRITIRRCSQLIDVNLDNPELKLLKLEPRRGMLPSIWTVENRICPSCNVNLYIDYILSEHRFCSWWLREFLIRSCKFFSSLSVQVRTLETCFHLWRMDINNKDRWLASIACNRRQLLQSPNLGSLSRKIEKELSPEIGPTNCSFLLTCHPNTITLLPGLSGDGFLQFFFERLANRVECRPRLCVVADGPESWPYQLKDMKIIQIVPGSDCEAPTVEHL